MTARSIEELKQYFGRELGLSGWHPVSQDDVNEFDEVTADREWIYTDPAGAADGPFRTTIAHGYYTLSLAPALLDQVISFDGFAMAVNYGLDKLRFPTPLPVGESVRLHAALTGIDEFPGGATLTVALAFERSGADKLVCVASALYRVVTGGSDEREPGPQSDALG